MRSVKNGWKQVLNEASFRQWCVCVCVYEDVVTLCSSCLCFSTASSRLRPIHSASSSGISNCCSETMHKKRKTQFVSESQLLLSLENINVVWIAPFPHMWDHSVDGNKPRPPCICCRPSLSWRAPRGKALCSCAPGEAAWPSSGPSPTWSSGLPSMSDRRSWIITSHVKKEEKKKTVAKVNVVPQRSRGLTLRM